MDGAGNLLIADWGNHRIRKVDPAGVIATVAGTGEAGFSGDGGLAVEARLRFPAGVAVDGAGNLLIADTDNERIRKVDPAGVIATVAGTGEAGFGGDGGAATEAQLASPAGVAVDGAGNLFIADRSAHRIRKVDPAGVIATVAGTGERGFGGDGGAATEAQLASPAGVAVDGAGNLLIADTDNERIRKVDPAGVIATVAGIGERGFSGDGGGATEAQLTSPAGMAVDGAGNLFIADRDNHRIRKVDPAGVIATVAGTVGEGDGGAAVAARLAAPAGVAADEAGNLFIADTHNHRIRKVDPTGVIATVAGTGEAGFSGDGGAATEAQLGAPTGVAVDGAGNLFIADRDNGRIRKVDPAGVIATVAGTGEVGDGGAAVPVRLAAPAGVAVDGAGNLFIADGGNHRIRKVDPAGVIATVAGTGERGFSGDGGAATEAQLTFPTGVAVDGAGNLFIADGGNHRIRKVDPAGVIATVAGNGKHWFNGDGGAATEAQLSAPAGVALDAAGNLFIASSGHHRIHKVDPAGIIVTVAGTGERGFSGDGGGAAAARLNRPVAVAVDGAGNLFIADTGNDRIRKVTRPREPAAGSPRISAGGVVSATGTPVVSRISPNAIVSVFGQDFAPQGAQAANPAPAAADGIATELAAACLEIDGKRAPLFAVFPTQINAQAPHDLTPGQVQVAVVRGCGAADEQRSAAAAVEAAAVSPAFFNFVDNGDGRNPLAALHGGGPELAGAPGLLPGAVFTPAAPGESVSLYGTGFGPTEPPLEAGQIPDGALPLANEVSFTIGGIAVPPEDIFYAGAAPCCAGLYQFTMRVPPAVEDGDAPVIAVVQGVSTPAGPFLTVRRGQ